MRIRISDWPNLVSATCVTRATERILHVIPIRKIMLQNTLPNDTCKFNVWIWKNESNLHLLAPK